MKIRKLIVLLMTIVGIVLVVSGVFAATYHYKTSQIMPFPDDRFMEGREADSSPYVGSFVYVYPYTSVGLILGALGAIMLIIGVLLLIVNLRKSDMMLFGNLQQNQDHQKHEEEGFGIRNQRLIILGVVFLVIGSVASYYQWATQLAAEGAFGVSMWQMFYPSGNVGIILLVAGVVFIVLGFLFPSQRTQQRRILSLGTRNLGLVVFGMVFLIMGLVTSYYQVTQLVGSPNFLMWWQIVYPYRNEGIILLGVGTVLTALGFLFPYEQIVNALKEINNTLKEILKNMKEQKVGEELSGCYRSQSYHGR